MQLQTSRVFWVIDLLRRASASTWLLAEGGPAPRHAVPAAVRHRPWRPALVALVLLVVSAARGFYIMRVEHPERPFVQAALEDTDWVRVGPMDRHAHRRSDTHVLADPDHDWKFGHSVRITARRDVLVEGVKDAALSLYDRDVAMRVQDRESRRSAISRRSMPRQARALARRFDLDLLLIDRDLPLPELHRDGRFRVYRLR